jgi:hypothetical protein
MEQNMQQQSRHQDYQTTFDGTLSSFQNESQPQELKVIQQPAQNANLGTLFRKPKNEHGNFSAYQFGAGDM